MRIIVVLAVPLIMLCCAPAVAQDDYPAAPAGGTAENIDWAEYARIEPGDITLGASLQKTAKDVTLDLSFRNVSARVINVYKTQMGDQLLTVTVNGKPKIYSGPSASMPPSRDLYQPLNPGETYVAHISLGDYYAVVGRPGDKIDAHYKNESHGLETAASLTVP